MAETTDNQDYVPQFYLRGFTIPGQKSLIWQFDKQLSQFRKSPQSIRKICSRYRYYRQVREGGTEEPDLLEKGFSGQLERKAAPLFKKIMSMLAEGGVEVPLTPEEYGHLCYCAAIQYTRVPAFRDKIAKRMQARGEQLAYEMADRDARYSLSGLVELDESFFGPAGSGKRGRGAEKKQLVMIAVSGWKDADGTERPGFAHAFVAEDASAETIERLLRRLGIPDPQLEPLIKAIRTDGWRSYETVAEKLGLIHYRAVLGNPKDASSILPWTHQLIGNAKAVFSGPHRGVSPKHLQRYLSEVCYRFNRRFWNRETFDHLLTACVSTDTVTRDELMAARG